jgi:DNA polymerase III subunit beta
MQFTCSTSSFLQALQLTSRAISGQQALPILGNILVQAEGDHCTLSATDLELSIVTTIPATVETAGSVTVPAKAILNFAQFTSDPDVTITVKDGTQIHCKAAHGKTVLSGEAASNYPSITMVESEKSFALDGATLLDALHYVTFASARSSLRPVLSGVSLRAEDGKIIFVATDSYRLSEYAITADAPKDLACIIPVKVLDELKILLAGKKLPKRSPTEEAEPEGTRSEALPVTVILGHQQIELKVGETHLLSRLIEGTFPDYRQIIPKEYTLSALLPLKDLTTAVRRMHYFAKEMNNTLTFSFTAGQAQISTPQTPIGKDEATIPVEGLTGEGKIALSSSYLLDFLAHAEGEAVTLRMVDSMHPAVFHLPGNDRLLHLVMPLRMQE